MVATSDNAAVPASPLAEFRLALGFYGLWAALATLGVMADQTTLAANAAWVLVVGIAATNAMFLLIARSNIEYRPPEVTITLAQSVMAVTWTTLFAFMSAGSSELVFGMYVTAILFALPRVRRAALLQLGIFTLVCFASITLIKASLSAAALPQLPELTGILVFGGLVSALLLSSRGRSSTGLLSTTEPLRGPSRTTDIRIECDSLQSSSDRRYILDSLEREKGRTDRSNNPFTIAVLAVDNIDSVMRDYGSVVGALVLQRFAKRVRGEMRAMDGVHRNANPGSFDRVGADRYVALLPQTNLSGGNRCAERIRAAISRYPIDGQYTVTVSGGIVEYKRGESVASLLERAEAELARAQAAGGNRICGHEATEGRHADVIPLHGVRT